MFLSLKVGGGQKEGCNNSEDIEINIAVIGLVSYTLIIVNLRVLQP
jgi:hypothetical protein